MSSIGLIGVIGATGAQGGSLVDAALKGNQKVRAFTRDTSKEKAVALKDAGAEVVALDLDTPETMEKAFEGVTHLFVVTNFWESMSPAKEKEQVQAVVKAAEAAGVKHYVWSTLENSKPYYDALPEDKRVPKLTGGYYVPHYDAKGEANAFFPKEKTTFLYTTFYLDNFYNFGMVSNGVLCNNVPQDKPYPVMAAADIGTCAYGIFAADKTYLGKEVYVTGEVMTFGEVMKIVSEVTGKEYKHATVDRATYAGFGFPGADDLANMFDYMSSDPSVLKNHTVAASKELNPELQTVKQWAETNKEALLKVGPE